MEIPSFFFYSVNNELESFQLLFRAFPPSKPFILNLIYSQIYIAFDCQAKSNKSLTRQDFPIFFFLPININ